jgi:hypothetical protein
MSLSGRAVVISEYAGVDASISLKRLDHVDIIEMTDKWWYVSCEGRMGYYPAFCFSELRDQPLPEGWVKCFTTEKSMKIKKYFTNRIEINQAYIFFL